MAAFQITHRIKITYDHATHKFSRPLGLRLCPPRLPVGVASLFGRSVMGDRYSAFLRRVVLQAARIRMGRTLAVHHLDCAMDNGHLHYRRVHGIHALSVLCLVASVLSNSMIFLFVVTGKITNFAPSQ